ncbi:MAG: hypothetical protein Q8P21_00595, partial [bacterium]|nr:hypothetical protein [bacterium]
MRKVLIGIALVLLVVCGLFTLVSSGITGTIIATLILWILATVTIYLVRQLGLNWIIIWFAERDEWWSPVRMKPGPGHVVMMTKGRKLGGP